MSNKQIIVVETDETTCATTSSLEPLPGGASPNLIINGDMRIAQRGTSAVAGIASAFSVDRFGGFATGSPSGAWDINQSDTIPSGGLSLNSLQADVTTADTSIGASELYMIRYQVEGLDAGPLQLGTSDASTFTLSFFVRSPKSGIHCVAFKNGAQDRVYVVEYDMATADTYQKVTITVPGDIMGTWLKNNGIGMQICWVLAAVSDWHTTADSWLAGDDYCTSNQVNCMDDVANNFYLAGVKLEVGDMATAFIPRPFGDELFLCQRYFQSSYPLGLGPGSNSFGGLIWHYTGNSNTVVNGAKIPGVTFPVPMRAAPSVTTYSKVGTAGTFCNGGLIDVAANANTVNVTGETGYLAYQNSGGSVATTQNCIGYHYAADAEL